MPYCTKCGKELSEGAEFCPTCGAPVKPTAGVYGAAAERIGHDRLLQEHWIRRAIAFVIDSIIVGIATAIVFALVFFPLFLANPIWFLNWLTFPFAMGLIYLLYFTLAEASYGYTFGKALLGLKVVAGGGGLPNLGSAFIRNTSKIYWILLILDIIGGFLISADPHQKYSDRMAHTTVV